MANSYDQMKMQSDYADEESMGAGGLYSLLRDSDRDWETFTEIDIADFEG